MLMVVLRKFFDFPVCSECILSACCLQSFFAERFFALFDSDGSGSISLDELLKALNLLIHGDETDKLRFLFQVYDVDGMLTPRNPRTSYFHDVQCS